MPRNPTPESFREEVERRALRAGKTDDERATEIGVSRQTLVGWRLNKADLRISQLAKLAAASRLPLALYFDVDAENEPAPIEWDRLREWLSSITAMVEATLPDLPVGELVGSAAADKGTKPEQADAATSPDPTPAAQAQGEHDAPSGQ